MHLRLTTLAGFIAVVMACPLRANDGIADLPLEDLLSVEVQGASRYAQPLAETPASASVVTAGDIRRFGFRDLGEALQSARGVYTSNDRAYSYLGVRGFSRPGDYNSRILLLVDGARSNDPIYDQALLGNEAPLDIDWVKRLEFVPGPSSASYGGNALFGIVNAVLWTGADLNGSRLSVDAGSGGTRRASLLSGGRTAAGLDWVAGLSAYGRSGDDLYFAEYDAPGVGDGVAHQRDGERYLKAMLKGSWENWRGSATFSQRQKDVPTAYFGTVFDAPGNFVRDTGYHLDLARTSTLTATLDQQLRVHLGRYAYDADYPLPGGLNRDETRADWWSGEWQLTWTGWRNHRLLTGLEVRRYGRLAQRNFDVAPRVDNLDDHHRGRSTGLFVQDEWRLAPGWMANMGLRVDSQTTAPTIASPRAALIWRPHDTLTVKLMGGRAFRAPNDYERHYDDGIWQKGNPALRPERIETRELALDFTPTSALRIGVGHYQYSLRDLIDQEQDPADGLLVYRNRDRLTARGWETDIEMSLDRGWRARGSLTWQAVEQPGGEPTNSPRRLGKLLIDGPIAALDATLGLNLQAVGPRRTLLGSVAGHVSGNVVLRQAQQRGYGLWSIGLYNLTDKRYRDPLGAEVAPLDSLERARRQWRLRWELAL